jgi:carbon storage regulator
MLILNRFAGEAICIGDNITIVVVEVRGDKVRLGIEAPREVRVHREEVAKAIAREAGQQEPQKIYSQRALIDACEEAEVFLERVYAGELIDPQVLSDVLARLRRAHEGVDRSVSVNTLEPNAKRYGRQDR